MAGIAFGSLAVPDKELDLHKAGKLAVLFKRYKHSSLKPLNII
jgi:hypothetical protein